jgi:hypothetical protein
MRKWEYRAETRMADGFNPIKKEIEYGISNVLPLSKSLH